MVGLEEGGAGFCFRRYGYRSVRPAVVTTCLAPARDANSQSTSPDLRAAPPPEHLATTSPRRVPAAWSQWRTSTRQSPRTEC